MSCYEYMTKAEVEARKSTKGEGKPRPEPKKHGILVRFFLAIGVLMVTSGCASITHGTKQDITFEAPPQQVCYITQGETMIASIAETQTIKVSRSKEPITVDCGSEKKTYAAEINAAAYTSIMWLDFGLVDFATGAAWTYSEKQ